MRDPALWQRCLDYSLPQGPEGEEFGAWCADEENITPSQAKGLLREYKRFTYLAACGALEAPVAAGLVGRVSDLHEDSGDGPRYRREVLAGASWLLRARLRRGEREALKAAYEAEFGEPPFRWYWKSRSKALYWAIAGLFVIGGAGLSIVDGSLAPPGAGRYPGIFGSSLCPHRRKDGRSGRDVRRGALRRWYGRRRTELNWPLGVGAARFAP